MPRTPRFSCIFRRASFSLALLVATSCVRNPATAVAVPAPSLPESRRPRELSRDEQVTQALSRLTYGVRDTDIVRVKQLGLDRWLTQQLTPENWPDRTADSVLAGAEILVMNVRDIVDSSPPRNIYIRNRLRELGRPENSAYVFDAGDSARFRKMNDLGNRRQQQFLEAKMARAVVADHQLLELMTDFWENHFSVFRGKMPTRFSIMQYERETIRPHALGKFCELLGAVAHSAAMLFYLDNAQSSADSLHLTLQAWQNLAAARTANDSARIRNNQRRRRGGLNENYARELLELHTLGVDSGYSQADVVNVARALTGWSLDAPQQGGGFKFNPATHDAEAKWVLGHALPAGRGAEDGEQVLDILARHPSTARYLATKLVRHFVSDSPPPALVERAAAQFLRTNGDIRRTLALIVSSPEFYSRAAVGAKVKTPYQLVVSTYRAVGLVPDSQPSPVGLLGPLGQPLFGRESPDGWPDDAKSWLNTGAMLSRINFAVTAGSGRIASKRFLATEPMRKMLTDPAFQRR